MGSLDSWPWVWFPPDCSVSGDLPGSVSALGRLIRRLIVPVDFSRLRNSWMRGGKACSGLSTPRLLLEALGEAESVLCSRESTS